MFAIAEAHMNHGIPLRELLRIISNDINETNNTDKEKDTIQLGGSVGSDGFSTYDEQTGKNLVDLTISPLGKSMAKKIMNDLEYFTKQMGVVNTSQLVHGFLSRRQTLSHFRHPSTPKEHEQSRNIGKCSQLFV